LRHGTACALLANVNRNSQDRPAPYLAQDFLPWMKDNPPPDDEPLQLDDPIAHSNLLRATLFGLVQK
jgi:hypothetical protein